MDVNYDKLIEKIAKASGIDKSEIDLKVEAKREKLSGLISKEGAAQVIAAELGISFDNERCKIDDLIPGMRKVNVVGKIIRCFPVREFTTKAGDPGKVANIIIADDTSNIRLVLWDVNHIALIEKGDLCEGKVVEILNGSMRDSEIHLGSFSEIKPSVEVFDDVQETKPMKSKPIAEFNVGDNIDSRAYIVQSFEPRFFEVNKETGRKLTEEEKAAGAEVEKRALINIVLDDGSETIRAVAFNDLLPKLGLTELENVELLTQQRQNMLGKELVFKGNVRMNSYFNNPELILGEVEEINLDSLIEELEKKE